MESLDGGKGKFGIPWGSVIDTVVFSHDVDFSAERAVSETFRAKFDGAYGRPSWYTPEEDLGSGLFRKAIV